MRMISGDLLLTIRSGFLSDKVGTVTLPVYFLLGRGVSLVQVVEAVYRVGCAFRESAGSFSNVQPFVFRPGMA